MQTEIPQILTSFLLSSEDKILILKGKWGVGKTFFWNQYTEKNANIIKEHFSCYSYISLFGKNTLKDVKHSVLTNRNISNKKNLIASSKKLADKFKIDKILSLGTKFSFLNNIIGDANLNDLIEFISIDNYLICIDDIERMNPNLPITSLMGFADELAQQKNCKIIFIFNEDELRQEQKSYFEQYREKIVDIELTYNPTLENSLKLVFSDLFEKYPIIQETINNKSEHGFYIKNIRVLTKIRNIIQKFIEICPLDISNIVINDFIQHTIFLCHCYYELNSIIPFSEIKNSELKTAEWVEKEYKKQYQTYLTTLKPSSEDTTDNHEEDNEEIQKLHKTLANIKKIRQNLLISNPSKFSPNIICMMEHGYWDTVELREIIKEEIERTDYLQMQKFVQKKINLIWESYHYSFQDNLQDIISSFRTILTNSEEFRYLSLGSFLTHFDHLYIFQKIKDASAKKEYDLIRAYLESQVLPLKPENIIDALRSPDIDKDTKKYTQTLLDKLAPSKSNMSIDRFLDSLHPHGMSNDQINYLNSLTEDEYYYWLMSTDSNKNFYFYLPRLLQFYSQNNPSPLKKALIRIGKLNNLNKHRLLKEYDLDIDQY